MEARRGAKADAARQDISKGLQELDKKEPSEQAEFWTKCVTTRSQELEDIGGLAPDEIYNDALSRYFDSSGEGLQQVFALCMRDQDDTDLAAKGLLSKEGLKIALVDHFQLYRVNEQNALVGKSQECFDRLANVLGDGIDKASFAYAMRRLRLGILLNFYELSASSSEVYHIDYDDDNIHTKFNGPLPGASKTIYRRGHKFKVPVLGAQQPVEKGKLDEYLFTTKQKRLGTVHWVHLHRPKIQLVLAIGQIYRIPGTIQTTMRNLKNAQPQIHLNKHRERDRHASLLPTKQHVLPQEIFGDPSYEWSSLIYPSFCIDHASRRSLERYETWFHDRQNRNKKSDEPPPVYVAVCETAIGVIWSDSGTSTIVTTNGQASYIGKLVTDTKDATVQSGWWDCLPCCRRAKPHASDGYEPLSTSPDSDDEEMQKDGGSEIDSPHVRTFGSTSSMKLAEAVHTGSVVVTDSAAGMEASNGATSRVSFDGVFEKTLLALYSQNSLLRTGTNEQLMTRIILNSTQEYLDVMELYSAAITRLNWLLDKPNTPDKDSLIEKIAILKLELGHLLRIVEPFSRYVMPALRELSSPLEIVTFQIKDIDNNVNAFIPKCKSLIQQCESLTDAYDRKASDKMNSILNILTFITFVITPMQLLTGLYGMNFRIMPELEWHHGYAYFWVMSISFSLLFALLLYRFTQE